jgi:hypothetical protein
VLTTGVVKMVRCMRAALLWFVLVCARWRRGAALWTH